MKTQYALLYRWKIREGMEEEFIDAWRQMTLLIKEHRGGRGSRLHRDDEGIWYAYAQWESKEHEEQETALPEVAQQYLKTMQEATEERLPTIHLNTVADLLTPEDE